MTWRDLRLRIRALLAPRHVERELDDELAFHLEMEMRKMVALTIIGTVAIGLGLVGAAFIIFNAFVFRVDSVRDPDALFAVERIPSGNSDRVRFTRPQYEALRRETDVFSDAFATLPDITSRIDGRMMEGHLVTGNFFQVLAGDAALGRTLTPADDIRHAARPVMVLSHNGWSRLFANDPNIVGRSVIVSGFRYEIVGVTPERFRGLSLLPPDYWAPLSLVGQFRRIHAGREDALGIDVIGRLKPGLSEKTALARLAVWASRGEIPIDTRTANIRLQPRGTAVALSSGVLLGFSPLFFAFGLILMIGCANVANLLLARAVARQREIGIRLSLGAPRRRVIRQLLTESLLLALASAACALAISRVVLDTTTSALMSTMPPELAELLRHLAAPGTDWRVVGFLVIAAIMSTVFFGLVPALQATRLDLVRTVRGEITNNARPSRARNALIVVQVTASALLLICAGVFLRSAVRASALNPGLRTADTIIVEIVNEPFRTAMVAAVTDEPYVTSVAASWPAPVSQPRAAFGSSKATRSKTSVAYRFVSPEYFSVLDIGVLRGRAFTQAEANSNAALAVVSEATARRIWPNGDAVGQVLRLEPDPNSETRRLDEPTLPSQTLIVVGVVRDVAGFRIAGYSEAGVYVPASMATAEMDLLARVQGNPEIARRALLERLTKIDLNMGMVVTLRTLGRMETYPLQVAFWLTIVLGGLALILTLSGIFSVLSYLVEQRTKEIGVRIASLLCIVTACVLAASIPALRAARIDPIATLRQD